MSVVNTLSVMEIGIPLYMVISYVGIISICLLLRRIELGLAISFLFVFYMGYLYNRDFLLDAIEGSTIGLMIYSTLGFIIIILSVFFMAIKKVNIRIILIIITIEIILSALLGWIKLWLLLVLSIILLILILAKIFIRRSD